MSVASGTYDLDRTCSFVRLLLLCVQRLITPEADENETKQQQPKSETFDVFDLQS